MIIDEENNNIFIVEKLNSLKNELNRDQVNLKSVQRDIKQLENYDNTANYEYLNSLLDPIKEKGGKIPSQCPIPSCSFQLHNSFSFYTTPDGNDFFYFNPFFLASETINGSTIVRNGVTYYLDTCGGTYFANIAINPDMSFLDARNWYYPSASVNQCIPNVYTKYRLVSACMSLRYTGPLEEAKGVLGCSIIYEKNPYLGLRFRFDPNNPPNEIGARNPVLEKCSSVEAVRDSFYSSENSCLEGIKMLYFPLDNSYNEFVNICTPDKIIAVEDIVTYLNGTRQGFRLSPDCVRDGFGWLCYLQGCPYSNASKNFRLDYYLNYECIPRPELMNYMPVSIDAKPCLTNDVKKKILEEVQGKAIQKLNIY